MFPHERSLVKRLEGKPFALIGVNSDKDPKVIEAGMKEHQITWRSFWCGEKGTAGDIPRAWKVSGWPTLVLIDHKGIIRKKWVGSPGDAALDKAIDQLVREAMTGK